jgi:DnaJ-class molecular chaperone
MQTDRQTHMIKADSPFSHPCAMAKRRQSSSSAYNSPSHDTFVYFSENAKKIECAAGGILTAAGNPRDTQQAGVSMYRPQHNVSVVFHQKPSTSSRKPLYSVASDSCCKGSRAEDSDFGQTGSKCQSVGEHFERRKVAPVVNRCQVCSSVVMPKRSRGRLTI